MTLMITEFTGEFKPTKGRKPDATSLMLDEALKTSAESGKPQLWAGSGSGNAQYTRLRQRLTQRAVLLGYKVDAFSTNNDKDLAFKVRTTTTTPAPEVAPEAPVGPKKTAKASA